VKGFYKHHDQCKNCHSTLPPAGFWPIVFKNKDWVKWGQITSIVRASVITRLEMEGLSAGEKEKPVCWMAAIEREMLRQTHCPSFQARTERENITR
jgi:hypothetical protein